jgi:hypothetical protein
MGARRSGPTQKEPCELAEGVQPDPQQHDPVHRDEDTFPGHVVQPLGDEPRGKRQQRDHQEQDEVDADQAQVRPGPADR